MATLETAIALRALRYPVDVIVYFDEIDPAMLNSFRSASVCVRQLRLQRKVGVAAQVRLGAALCAALVRGRYSLVWVQYMTPTVTPLIVARLFCRHLIAAVHVAVGQFRGQGLRRIRWFARHWCSRVVCVSLTVAEGIFHCGRSDFWCLERVLVIPNALDVGEVKAACAREWRAELHWRQDMAVIGFSGRLAYIKGPDVLVQAAALVIRAGVRAGFVFVGDGADRRQLELMTEQLGIRSNSHFVGRLARDCIYPAIKGFDIAVVPSREEGFGLSALEAMAAGVALIASNVDALAELVVDGQTGLLCRVDDPTDLADKLIRLIDNDPLRHKLGLAASIRATAVYGRQSHQTRIAALLGDLGLGPPLERA